MALLSPEGRLLHVNRAFCALLGYAENDLLAMTVREITHPDDHEADLAHTRRMVAGEIQTYQIEKRYLHRLGAIVWVRVSASLVRGDAGEPGPSIVQLCSEMITPQGWLEQQRARLAERLDLAAHAAGIGIWDWDIQKNEVIWDDQMYALYGLQPGEFGGAYEAWLQGVHPEDRDMSHAATAAAVRGEREYDTEFRVLWPDGSTHWLKADGQVFRDQDGTPLRMVGVNYDITERRRLEERLRESEQKYSLLFEKSAVPTVLLRLPEVVIADANEACERLTGYTRSEMIGKNAVSLGLLKSDERAQAISQFTARGALIGAEISLSTRTGERRIVVINTIPVTIGAQAFAITTMQDITERYLMEDELRRSNAELEQFAYVASHDLKEPLRAVAGMVQLLGQRYRGQLDAQADEYIRHAVEAASRMQQQINDLLAYSRVDRRGKKTAPVQASACLNAALRNLDIAIAESGAAITADELPLVHADAVQLVQLFQNLIGNAIKFRGAKPPRIHIGMVKLHDAWQFFVRDNGIGIEPPYFERIFRIFQRLHTRREYPGTGIGLALCKKIVERHGGTIWVESQPGQGSTFFFTLPMRSEP